MFLYFVVAEFIISDVINFKSIIKNLTNLKSLKNFSFMHFLPFFVNK